MELAEPYLGLTRALHADVPRTGLYSRTGRLTAESSLLSAIYQDYIYIYVCIWCDVVLAKAVSCPGSSPIRKAQGSSAAEEFLVLVGTSGH